MTMETGRVLAPNSDKDPVSGTLVLLVGPSGSGKDSILDWAREELKDDPRILFVRRCITRQAGDPNEDHIFMTEADFEAAEEDGAFMLSWHAHGLHYGLPIGLLDHMRRGGVAIANGSRKTIPQLRERFANLVVVALTVRPDILAERLAKRGRETAEEIEQRLGRTKALEAEDLMDDRIVTLDNSGELSTAGADFVAMIKVCADRSSEVGEAEALKA